MAKRGQNKRRNPEWHEWLHEARARAEAGKLTRGRAVVRGVKVRKAKAPRRYTRTAWRKMTVPERVDVIAERLGLLEPPAVDR